MLEMNIMKRTESDRNEQDSKELSRRPLKNAPKTFNSEKAL
jgi:hypothetical protein